MGYQTDVPRPAPTTAASRVAVAAPVLVGVLCAAGFLLGPVSADMPATIVGIAALAYLSAAATERRAAAWVFVGVGTVVKVGAEVADVSWIPPILGLGVLLAGYGLLRRRSGTLIQSAAMLGYLGLAVVALLVGPSAGLALAGAVLAAHALWDMWHYRRDAVVHRPLALWCIGLDITAGTACVVLAATS